MEDTILDNKKLSGLKEFNLYKKYIKNNDRMNIDILNDDCLIHIFQFLSIVEKVRVERVCKYWQTISRESWINCKRLNLEKEFWGMTLLKGNSKTNAHAIYEVLKRCGRFLKDIEFFGYIQDFLDIGTIIGSFCPNLESVKLYGVSNLIIQNLANNCTNIKEFSLRDTVNSCDDELSLLLSKNKKLRSLELICMPETDGRYLYDLPAECIESLSILDTNIPVDYFNEAIGRFQNLSKLSVDICKFNDDSIKAISSISNLQNLQTGIWLGDVSSLIPIVYLNNLTTIELSLSDYVNDILLRAISKNCTNLSSLNISGCTVTDEGVAHITALPKLETLIINYLDITDKAFNPMPNLRIMECVNCRYITDDCFSKLIETSNKLQLLNVSNCNVSNVLLKSAIAATQKRTNNIILRMYVRGTRIKLRKIKEKSPLLQIITARRQFEAKCYM